MIRVRVIITILFTLLSTLNLYELLTSEGYRGGKVYVASTKQSIIMQICLIIGLIVYLIYLIKLNQKIPEFTKCPKCKNSYNYSDTKNGKCHKCNIDTIEVEKYYKQFPGELENLEIDKNG
jgi:hypothetical protein